MVAILLKSGSVLWSVSYSVLGSITNISFHDNDFVPEYTLYTYHWY